MFKQFIYISFVVAVLMFSETATLCLANAAAELEQARKYKQNGYFQQAEALYNTIIAGNPGTDYALEAQKDLVFLQIKMQKKIGTNIDPQPALNTLKSVYSTNSGLPKALYEIAAEYEKKRKYNKAKSLYQDIIQQYSSSSYSNKAQLDISKIAILALIQAGQGTAAQTGIDNFITQYSSNSYIVAGLNDIAYQWRKYKNFPKAVGLYQYIADTWPTSADAMWAQMGVAKSNVEAGDFTAATPALDKLLANYPSHPDLATAMHYIARSYRKAKKYADAKVLYQQISQRYPGSSYASNAQIEIGKMDILVLIDSGQDAAADAAINSLVGNFSGHPGISLALNHIAWEYEDTGKYDKAADVFQRVIDVSGNNFRAGTAQLDKLKCQTCSLINSGNDNTAFTNVNQLTSSFNGHPYMPSVVSQIAKKYSGKASQAEKAGNIELSRDYLQKAMTIWEKVIKELPASEVAAEACHNTGNCYHKLGDYQKSILYFQKVVDEYPLYDMAWYCQFMIGQNFKQMAQKGLISDSQANSQIRSVYEQLLEEYPDCRAAGAALNWLSQHKTQ